MSWTNQQITSHKATADKLHIIIKQCLALLSSQTLKTEYEAKTFIRQQLQRHHLATTPDAPIVAFGPNTACVHYFVKPEYARQLFPKSLILIDLWARQKSPGAPFADITWMAYFGPSIPPEIAKTFQAVIQARQKSLNYIRQNLHLNQPIICQKIDAVARYSLDQYQLGHLFPHSTGHPLGLTSPHGRGARIGHQSHRELDPNIAYSLEPAVYFPNHYGIRTEINFLISPNQELTITTPVQDEIIPI